MIIEMVKVWCEGVDILTLAPYNNHSKNDLHILSNLLSQKDAIVKRFNRAVIVTVNRTFKDDVCKLIKRTFEGDKQS